MATPTLQLPPDVESMRAEEILRFCVETFPGKLSLACSFQKEESVLLDLLFAIDPKARVFAIDTHYLFPETYELWREVEKRYDTKVEVFEGGAGSQRRSSGRRSPTSISRSPRSRRSTRRSLDLDCWITGVRRDQSPTRARRRSSAGTPSTSSGRRARSPTGATTTAGPTSGARAAVQPAARPGLRVDRRHALDAPGRGS